MSTPSTQIVPEPIGGIEGKDWDDGKDATIKQIKIVAGEVVDSICVQYLKKDGTTFWSEKRGASTGGDETPIELEPSEYVISISGTHGVYDSEIGYYHIVLSLTITTNKNVYGPFGNKKSEETDFHKHIPFHLNEGGKVVGFYGKSGTYIDAIGVHVVPLIEIIPDQEKPIPPHEKLGAYGGPEGKKWDDGAYTGIKTIKIAYDDEMIHSISTKYDNNGIFTWSEKHGKSMEGKIVKVKLAYPEEYITSITVYMRNYQPNDIFIIGSIRIETNNGNTWGPYGKKEEVGGGTPFLITPNPGVKVVGLHGTSGNYIDSIGAYVVPVSADQN